MKVTFWLLAAAVAAGEIAAMVWMLPPTKPQGQIAATIAVAEPNPNGGPVVCPYDSPCRPAGPR